MAKEYSKLGYGNDEDIDAAIPNGGFVDYRALHG